MFWRAFLLGLVTFCLSTENPILSPRFSDIMENSTLVLTCSAHQSTNYSKWGRVKYENKFSYMRFSQNGTCATEGFLADDPNIEIRCYRNGTFKVKIKRLAVRYHGQGWYCFDEKNHKSNTACINVQVPIKYVKIENSSDNIIETVENVKTTLTCETSEGRPAANITWTKVSKKEIRTDLTHIAKYRVTKLKNGMLLAQSSIDLKPRRKDNDTRIICESANEISNITRNEVTLHVQYPPSEPFFDQKKIASDGELQHNRLFVKEGSSFIVICRSDGDPPPTCTWNIENHAKSQNLTFTNITKGKTGSYECIAENVIRRFSKNDKFKTRSTSILDIDVGYRSQILQFSATGVDKRRTHFEVIANETVLFTCSVDSNPVSSIVISFKQRELVRNESTKSLSYTHRVNSCFDGGVYQCAAHNKYNLKPSLKNVMLRVRCIPILSPEFDLKTNMTSAKNVPVTLAFTAIAYPEPEFEWYKLSNSSWKTISSYMKYEIKTLGRYSSLTVTVTTEDDFGQYKLRIFNAVGILEQLYFLNPNEKPGAPTMFKHLQKYLTETSTILQWQPGFNGGPAQMFVLKYKLDFGENWTKVIVPDTGEKSMRYSLIDLEMDSFYVAELFALNSEGNSMTLNLTFKTQAKQQTTDSTMKWILICVLVGTFVSTITAVVMASWFCKFIRRKRTLKLSVIQTAEIISGSQTTLNFNPEEFHTMHEYNQLDEHCLDDEGYMEMQTMEAGNYPNRGYITPTM